MASVLTRKLFTKLAPRGRRLMHMEDPVEMEKAVERWRIASFYVCPIAIVFCSWYGITEEMSHWAHRDEYVAYPYLACRNKKFPWGDGNHTLFHNPKRNWVPGVGYEEDLD